MTTFAISSLGCKVNSYESEAYIQKCLELGYEQVDFKEIADIYLINTCAVTNTAASKSRQKIHAAVKLNPSAFVAVVGCYSQSASSEIEKIEGVNVVVGADQKQTFLNELKDLVEEHGKKNYVHELKDDLSFEDLPIQHFSRHTRAFLKIQDGCNQFCAYCIIPYARGRERSLDMDHVIQTAKTFVANHHYEIVLSGIHTGRYGRDLGCNLTTLLKRMLAEVEGLKRIRISSIEMNEVSDELIELMKNDSRIAAHLHIPIQSASDAVLRGMKRPYNMKQFMARIEEIRSVLDDVSISTDIIAGFPEESDADFEETMQNLEKIRFSFMHVFPFSKRDGTVAAKMKEVHGSIKKERAHQLNEMSNRLKMNYYQSWIGKTCQVMVETCKHGECIGYSSEYIPVAFEGNPSLIGNIVNVTIEEVNEMLCKGHLEE